MPPPTLTPSENQFIYSARRIRDAIAVVHTANDALGALREHADELVSWQTSALNESDTRSKIIDVLLLQVLGWDEASIAREDQTVEGEYRDYVIRNVALGSNISADEHRGYSTLDGFYAMARVNHGRGEYRRGKASTNSIEGFWALVKRCYIGTNHWWSRKHTQRYLDSCAFRLNARAYAPVPHTETLLMAGMNSAAALPYRTLVA